jgi:cytochrome P450
VPLRLGLRRLVLVSHPSLVEDVLVAKHRSFIKTPLLRNGRRLLGHGLLTSEGDLWRRQRRLMQPAFQRQRLLGYGVTMVSAADELLATWQDGQRRDVHADMMALTLDIALRTLFGAELGGESARVGVLVEAALRRFSQRLESLSSLVPDTWPIPGNLRFLRSAAELDRVVLAIIARRLAAPPRDDLLQILLDARDEHGAPMSRRQLKDEVMTLFLAGHETTASALSWTWYLLGTHPEVEAELHASLNRTLGGRPPTVDDLPELGFVERVVTESMRLLPPVWAIGRQAIEPVQVGGYDLPKGTLVSMSQWVMHRDPRWFDDPERFWPDRWLDGQAGQARKPPRYAYLPFGGGPRQCIGNSFALLEATLLLATLAQRFRLELVPDHPIGLWPSATLRPRHGIAVTLRQR